MYKLTGFTQLDRQTILRSFISEENNLRGYYCKEEGIALLSRMKELDGTSAFAFRKKELIRNLKDAGVVCSMEDSLADLHDKVFMLPSGEDMDRKLFEILYKVYSLAQSPADQIEKLVRRLGNPDYQKGSVRLAILKQFLKFTSFHTNPVKELIYEHIKTDSLSIDLKSITIDEYVAYADEYLFDAISGKLSKSDKRKYQLLTICDDLANGRFKSNGNTKVALYMFAFAYDMTVFVDPDKDIYDEKRDIEKNLFNDYYCNSLLRFISDDYKVNYKSYEAEPLGDGINYKNFAEVIYIYYLSKRNLSIEDRIKKAEKTIADCISFAQSGKNRDEQEAIRILGTSNRYTYIYKDMCMHIVRNLPENEIVPFVCNNYFIDTDNNSKAKVLDDSDTNTAAFYFYRKSDFNEQKYIDYNSEKQYIDDIWGNKDDFIDLVKKMIDILFAHGMNKEKRVSRIDILRMYYFNALAEEYLENVSLMDVFNDMRIKCNDILRTSRYQEISERNVFDVFVLIMLYRNVNLV